MWSLIYLTSLLATSQALPHETKSRSILISTSPAHSPCLKEAYYGVYGGQGQDHIYIPADDCLENPDYLVAISSGTIAPLETSSGNLVWIGHAGVEGIAQDNPLTSWNQIISAAENVIANANVPKGQQNQMVLGDVSPLMVGMDPPRLVAATHTSIVVQVSDEFLPLIDTILPPHLVPVVLPSNPLSVTSKSTVEEDDNEEDDPWRVDKRFADHLTNITDNLAFDPKLDVVLNTISMDEIRRHVRWMTGEAPSGVETRHSFTTGAVKTAHWLKETMEKYGAECHLEAFLHGFAPNVICTYPSLYNSTEHVILSAHFDSRGSFGSTRAPGGDDDASGVGHILGIADAIQKGDIKFEKSVLLAFFAGEEQGLLGSKAFAQKCKDEERTIILQVQTDMLGYHAPGEPMQIAFPDIIDLPAASNLLGNLSHLYSPELLVGRTPACCSDHQSFLALGFPATHIFERNGPIADPKYHNSADVSGRENYDFDQIVSIAKVTMAGILTVAGWSQA